jgi:hypothetical protein
MCLVDVLLMVVQMALLARVTSCKGMNWAIYIERFGMCRYGGSVP